MHSSVNMDAKKARVAAQLIISSVLLVASLYLVITEPENSAKLKWAFGMIGIIVGYWLK